MAVFGQSNSIHFWSAHFCVVLCCWCCCCGLLLVLVLVWLYLPAPDPPTAARAGQSLGKKRLCGGERTHPGEKGEVYF